MNNLRTNSFPISENTLTSISVVVEFAGHLFKTENGGGDDRKPEKGTTRPSYGARSRGYGRGMW